MKHASYCEVNFPIHSQLGNDHSHMLKRTPLPSRESFDRPKFHAMLIEALSKGRKRDVIHVLAKRLSELGEFTDLWEKHPEGWDRLEEMRGR